MESPEVKRVTVPSLSTLKTIFLVTLTHKGEKRHFETQIARRPGLVISGVN